MANHRKKQVGKRKSKGWRKRSPKCTLCTYFRWLGNSKGRKRHSYYRQQKVAEDYQTNDQFGGLGWRPSATPSIRLKKEQQQMLKRSNKSQRRGTRSHSDADLRHMREKALHREIKKQSQKQQEIENRRKKRKLIFWSLVFSGAAVIAAGASVLYFFILD